MRYGITTTVDHGSELATLAWCGERARPAENEGRRVTHSPDWSHVSYWFGLLVCGSVFGLFLGGYVGFMENATPHADPPYSFAQLAATDVGWAAKMRQDWLASHPLESAAVGQRLRETHWQRLLKSAAIDSGSGGRPSPTMCGGHFVRLDAPAACRVPHSPNHETEFGERIAHGQ